MKICHIVPSLEERHGGPSKSVRALANATAGLGVETDLLTTVGPESGAFTQAADAATIRIFPRDRPRWLCPSAALRAHLSAQRYACVHAHALWLRTLHYARQAAEAHAAPLVISPRGMMSGWAYRHRRWRKRIAECLVHPGAFAAAHGWHATSQDEADDIRALGFKQPICIAPNGVELPSAATLNASRAEWSQKCPALVGRRVAVFYSRFHRKKRVRELVDIWFSQPRGEWFLLLVGVPEEYEPAEIDSWIARAGGTQHAAAFDGSNIVSPFGIASLFLLPSHSENFGLVIAEALAAGVPALVTDQTPWHDLAQHQAGWCEPWGNWSRTLDLALQSDASELSARGRAGAAWMARDFTWASAAQRLIAFDRELISV